MAAQTPFKMARVGGEALPLAKELIEEFKAKGYRASLAGVVEAGVKVLHSHVLGGYHLLSHAESLEHRAQDVGTSIATVLGSLCLAKVDMSGCQLGYHPSVDAIFIRLNATGDILVHVGGADPARIANIVKDQLGAGGYLQDDGVTVVDMEQLVGAPRA